MEGMNRPKTVELAYASNDEAGSLVATLLQKEGYHNSNKIWYIWVEYGINANDLMEKLSSILDKIKCSYHTYRSPYFPFRYRLMIEHADEDKLKEAFSAHYNRFTVMIHE